MISVDQDGNPSAEGKYFYIRAMPIKQGRKTRDFAVISRKLHMELGRITWYGQWRQYAFVPEDETVWSHDCLADVSKFIQHVMDLRKK